MKKRPILAFLIILLCFATVSISFAENISIGFSGTEMRSKPNAMDSKVVTKIDPYSPVTVIEKVSDYYNRGRNGWVHRSLLSNTPGVVVTSDNANLRRGPGTNHPVVFQLSKGMTAKFLEKQNKWVRVQTADGKNGWVANFLVWGD
jgi:uncharacterized protein YgiM (DUF1202 family)